MGVEIRKSHGLEPIPGAAGRIGPYRLIAPLSEGGMARIYVAQRDGSRSVCVLKQLLGSLRENEVAVRRFAREARLTARIHHPRIARILDAGTTEGAFFIAIEYVPGKDLEAIHTVLLDRGQLLPYALTVYAALGVLEGLEHAHSALDSGGQPLGLVHRDLSPRNVMLAFDGQVKVIDFGLARGRVDSFETAPGTVLGTLRYMSPEQALSLPVDHRSDLYSLSAMLYELLTGRSLIVAQNPSQALLALGKLVVTPPSTTNPGLPRELDPVIMRGLAKDPRERWQNALDYRLALKAAAGPLTAITPIDVGAFLRQFFPEDEARARGFIQQARARYVAEHGEDFANSPTVSGEPPPAPLGPMVQATADHLESVTPKETSFDEEDTASSLAHNGSGTAGEPAVAEEGVPTVETQPRALTPRLSIPVARSIGVSSVLTPATVDPTPGPWGTATPLSLPRKPEKQERAAAQGPRWSLTLAAALIAGVFSSVLTAALMRPQPSLAPSLALGAPANPGLGALTIESTPLGAGIWIDGAVLLLPSGDPAKTPTEVQLAPALGRAHRIELSLPGHRPAAVMVVLGSMAQRVHAELVEASGEEGAEKEHALPPAPGR